MEGVRFTPYNAVHGFAGSSAVRSAVGAVADIPTSLVTNTWLSNTIQQSQHLINMYATHKEAEAYQQQREQSMVRTKKVEVGQLVLLRKPSLRAMCWFDFAAG